MTGQGSVAGRAPVASRTMGATRAPRRNRPRRPLAIDGAARPRPGSPSAQLLAWLEGMLDRHGMTAHGTIVARMWRRKRWPEAKTNRSLQYLVAKRLVKVQLSGDVLYYCVRGIPLIADRAEFVAWLAWLRTSLPPRRQRKLVRRGRW
jgi:hypothetical protein